MRERLRGFPIQVVEDVPAQNAVHAFVFLRKARREKRGQLPGLAFADEAIDVLEDVLDENLAAQFLAEEGDVGADDGTEVEQQRLRLVVQAGEKLGESLGRMRRRVGAALGGVRLVLLPTGKEV